jgi:hypothetical protein
MRGLLLSDYWAEDIIRPIIEYKLMKKGYFMIHGGAVCDESTAHVVSGRSGVFKTTLLMDLVRKRKYSFLGDERVIISKDGILAFPMSLFLFNHTLNHSVTEKMSKLEKIKLLYRIITKRVLADVNIVKKCNNFMLFFIEKRDRVGVESNSIDLNQATIKMIANTKLELAVPTSLLPASNFLQYMMAYSFIFPNNEIARYWIDYEQGLKLVLAKITTKLMEIPEQYDINVFGNISTIMKE